MSPAASGPTTPTRGRWSAAKWAAALIGAAWIVAPEVLLDWCGTWLTPGLLGAGALGALLVALVAWGYHHTGGGR